jgi:DNA-binding transcriptional LysR family regulator
LKTEIIKTRGNLTTNDGSIAVQWTLDVDGILMRAAWDIRTYFAQGQSVRILLQFRTPDVNICAVYRAQYMSAAQVKAFVDFLDQTCKPNLN